MAQYLVLIYEDESGWQAGGPAAEAGSQAHREFGQKYADVLRGGEALQPTGTATTIRAGPWRRSFPPCARRQFQLCRQRLFLLRVKR